MSERRLFDTREASVYLHLEAGTLENWRCQRRGPKWFRPEGSRVVRYDKADLDAWIEEQKARPVP